MKVKFTIDTGYASVYWTEEQEFYDDTTDEEIQDAYDAWVLDCIDLYWERLDD